MAERHGKVRRGIPVLTAALTAAVLLGGRAAPPAVAAPGPPPPPDPVHVELGMSAQPTAADLTRVRAIIAGLAAAAADQAAEVERAALRGSALRLRIRAAADRRDAAAAQLDAAVRAVYMASGGSPTLRLLAGVSLADAAARRVAGSRVLAVDTRLVRARAAADGELAGLVDAARRDEAALLASALAVEQAQARARDALAQAEQVVAAQAAADAAARAERDRAEAELAGQRAALDASSRQVALTVTPAVGAAGLAVAAAQAPVLDVLGRTPAGAVPAGYHRTGQVVRGLSSWYGPGFVGSPTSSGSPYDPEQLTCAMLAVPLGTVVRVTTDAGRVVTVLVTDHGPYAGIGRVIDLSAAAARLAGVGLTPVTVEVLSPDP